MKRIEIAHVSRIAALALFTNIVGFAMVANAESATSHKGSLTIKTEAVVQGTTLPAGNYEVREVQTAQGPSVEFVRKYWNEAASEMVQAEEDQLVAQLPVVEQPLAARAAHTRLDGNLAAASGVEIRGVPVEYVFAPVQSSSRTVASTNCNTSGN